MVILTLVGAAPAHAEQIEAGKRIGSVEVLTFIDEVIEQLGEPDWSEAYPSGNAKYFVYEQPQLQVLFDDPSEDEIVPSTVIMIHTKNPGDTGTNGVTVGSSSADVVAAYGDAYKRLEGEGTWAMFYGSLGIRFEFENSSDLVIAIGVFSAHTSG